MPRESVFDKASQFTIEIGWTKEREDVQVGLAIADERSIADWLAGQEAHVPPGSPQLNDPRGVPASSLPTSSPLASSLPQFNSLWATLDRAQINRLIKLLRKARDEAYGRDE